MEQVEKHGHGRVLSKTRGPRDLSDYLEIFWQPVIGSVTDGDVRCRDKGYYSRVVEILGNDELRRCLDDMYQEPPVQTDKGVKYSGMYFFRPKTFIHYLPQVFWNVVYKAQPVVPKEGRLQLDEMLQKVMPDLDWEYLRPSVVTQASAGAI